jgi:hypothetical protein
VSESDLRRAKDQLSNAQIELRRATVDRDSASQKLITVEREVSELNVETKATAAWQLAIALEVPKLQNLLSSSKVTTND